MPLEGNRNPNNVIRMEYEVRLLGHDCDYKANSSFLLSTTIINFSAIGKLFKDGAGLRRNQLAKLRRWYTVWKNTVLEKYTLENRNLKAVGHSFQKICHVPWSTDALLHRHSGHLKVWPTYPSSHWGRFQRCSRLKKYQTTSKSLQWRTGSVGWYRVDIGLPRGHLARNDDKFTHFLPQLSFVGDIFAIWSQLSHLFLTTLLRPVFRWDFSTQYLVGRNGQT